MSRSGNRSCVLASIVLATTAFPAQAQNLAWLRQFGTVLSESAFAAAPDGSGGMYFGGDTSGSLGGQRVGSQDVVFGRYDGDGNQLWIRQLGTKFNDSAYAAASDGSGGLYLGGSTSGSFGGARVGGNDAWFARFDGAGNQLWSQQIGTIGYDSANAAASDSSGGLYVCGHTCCSLGGMTAGFIDAWLAHYDGAGNALWIRQLGTSGFDVATSVASDASGGVFVSGYTNASLGGQNAGLDDAWFAHYDGAGNQLWIRQLGTSEYDLTKGVVSDASGGVYVAGQTNGTLGGQSVGGFDAWLAHYDGAGNQVWIRQFGTSSWEYVYAVARDILGGVYVTGTTFGNFGGPNAGKEDAWVARYDGVGNYAWVRQIGTNADDLALSAAPTSSGGVFIVGRTSGPLGGRTAGSTDVWLARFDDDGCSPPATYCTAQVSSSGCVPSMSSLGVPSLNAPGLFHVIGSKLEASQDGIMFFGTSGPNNLPFGGGILCAKAPLYRLKVKSTSGGAACTGMLRYTLSELLAQPQGGLLLVAYQLVHIQTWFRDPIHQSTAGLSNGLQFTICP